MSKKLEQFYSELKKNMIVVTFFCGSISEMKVLAPHNNITCSRNKPVIGDIANRWNQARLQVLLGLDIRSEYLSKKDYCSTSLNS